MKKNAFTLIELLAVIIIIGLLAVIIIPKIGKTIEDSKKNTNEISAKSLVRYANSYYLEQRGSNKDFNGCQYNFENNSNTCAGFEFSGEKPETGSLNILEDGTVTMNIKLGDYCYLKDYNTDDVEILEYNEFSCKTKKEYTDEGESADESNLTEQQSSEDDN